MAALSTTRRDGTDRTTDLDAVVVGEGKNIKGSITTTYRREFRRPRAGRHRRRAMMLDASKRKGRS